MATAQNPDILLEDFGQKVDLTRRIREVLLNYPEGTTVLKELIQNADDAGATVVKLCVDRRQHGTNSLLSSGLMEFQLRPALLAYNDAVFTETDFRSISRIGGSGKNSARSWKTGRFGVGFNSVYHLTDLPSFVSGNYVVLFDPQLSFLPNVSSSNPGKRIDFVKTNALQLYPDQFSPFMAFGCDMAGHFSGTLFRFPLRSQSQAESSCLSKQAYDGQDVVSMFQQLFLEGIFSLLFLKNVLQIEMYTWDVGEGMPKLSYSCRVNSVGEDIISHRQALLRLTSEENESEIGEDKLDGYLIEFVCEDIGTQRKNYRSFFVVQCMASKGSRINTFAKKAAKEYDMHLLPWGAVAACVSTREDSAENPGVDLTVGRAFCFLPLPVTTGLRFHVNGYFEVASNRRGIWYGGDMDRSGKVRSIWNRLLLEDIITLCFKQLLINLRDFLGPTDKYYSFWPVGSFDDPWKILVESIYKEVSQSSVVYSEVGGGKWVSPVESFLHDEGFVRSVELGEALIQLDMPIVRLPASLFDMVLKCPSISPQKVVGPKVIRQFLRESRDLKLLSRLLKLVLLEYCLEDLIDAVVGFEFSGLQLLPVANGSCVKFFPAAIGNLPYFICDELEYLLLERVSDRVIDHNIPGNIYARLLAIAKCSTTNISAFSLSSFLALLPRLVPKNWQYSTSVLWDPASNRDHPTEQWLTLFWQYIQTHCKSLSDFSDWPIFPSTSGYLYRPSRHLKLLNSNGVPVMIQQILLKLGCKILNSSIGVAHADLSSFVYDANLAGILSSILDAILSSGSLIQSPFRNLSAHEKDELRDFLFDPKWYIGISLDSSLIKNCRNFPIYRVYDGVDEQEFCFAELENPVKFLPPLGISQKFLDNTFIATKSGGEADILLRYFGVERMQETHFYKHYVFTTIYNREPADRDNIMLSILEKLPQLCVEDPSIKDVLRNLEFVPTSLGSLNSPSRLYDPRNDELRALLEDCDSFPSGPFQNPEILYMLSALGLRTSVSIETIIETAKHVEKLVHEDPQKALHKGKVLLSYLEVNASKWMTQHSNEVNRTVSRIFSGSGSAFESIYSRKDLERFWNELRMICWCPAVVTAPFQSLPWPDVSSAVAPPKQVRLPSDLWIVSASMRILEGECSSSALAHCLGWLSPPGGSVIAAQLLELGMNNEIVSDQKLRHELTVAMPKIYSIMLSLLGSDEMVIIKAILEGSRWIWVGDGFATSDEVILDGPLHLPPYVRVIPTDLAVFKNLFFDLGVKEYSLPSDYVNILTRMSAKKGSSPLDAKELKAVILIIHHLDESHLHTRGMRIFLPDCSGRLFPAPDLVYNDAPWLLGFDDTGYPNTGTTPLNIMPNKSLHRYVHGTISNEVAERLGVCSLRTKLLTENSDSMKFGLSESAEAFGQHEALTTRLKHILEMYADGPGILFELIQNAEDAGASEVKFLLDKSQYGTDSVLSVEMADWQGPALYCFNDSVFSTQDLYAISRIGQESKLEKPFAIGRFGLGFNSVYHFTDVPTFVSGENIVMFDPHARNLPGISPSQPGLRIKFAGKKLLEQFPDQFSPLLHFGCDLQGPFPGTLFRFPLRNPVTALRSQIKKEVYDSKEVMNLIDSFSSTISEVLLFLRNVREISVYVKEGNDSDVVLLHRVHRSTIDNSDVNQAESNDVFKFINQRHHGTTNRDQLLKKLRNSTVRDLPYRWQKIVVTEQKTSGNLLHGWITVECLRRGPSRSDSSNLKELDCNSIPYACVARHIQSVKMDSDSMSSLNLFQVTAENIENLNGCDGRAFCFLPLPFGTGLPVHINAYFELSSNRRDLWFGNDMLGGGKKRSEWNMYILEDVVAPAYAHLLEKIGMEVGSGKLFFACWPSSNGLEPWASMVRRLYAFVADSDLRVLHTKARNGQWISAKQALFPDFSFDKMDMLIEALPDSGLPLVHVCKPLVDQFMEACPSLNFMTPHLLRTLLVMRKRLLKDKLTIIATLEYCLMDLDVHSQVESLCGLSLLPLADGSVASFERYGTSERIFVAKGDEYKFLNYTLSHQLVDCCIPNSVHVKLCDIAEGEKLNISFLSCSMLEKLFFKFLPPEWQFSKSVAWHPGDSGHPTSEWIFLLWSFLKSNCDDLSCFSKWPILPVGDSYLMQLVPNSNVIMNDGWSENLSSLLLNIGCQFLTRDMNIEHPQLLNFVQPSTASGVLNAVLAIAGEPENIAKVFSGASDSEIHELRSFILQTKWFSDNLINEVQINLIKYLPIFETYKSKKLVCLNEGTKWLRPIGIGEDLLDDRFVRIESEKERAILKNFLKIFEPSKAEYYAKHVLINISNFLIREGAVSTILHDVKLLFDEDSSFKMLISSIPFVMAADRSWKKPSSLYDPRIPELNNTLHKGAFFPSSEFLDKECLDILVDLGLRRTLDFTGILDCAKSVEMKHDSGDSDAVICAKKLLTCLDELSMKLSEHLCVSALPLDVDNMNYPAPEKRLTQFQDGLDISLIFNYVSGQPDEGFWSELRAISWCPVYVNPPIAGLPWMQPDTLVASPYGVRPMSQMWIVSCTMHILDGECKSCYLQEKLGWNESPRAEILSTQLIQLSESYEKLKLQPTMRSDIDSVLQNAIPQLYSKMLEYVSTDDIEPLKIALNNVNWIWIGDDFVQPSVLAFDSPVKFTPYLYAVPSELHFFKDLLMVLGVRLCFDIWDYLRVLERLHDDVKDHPLSEDQLCFAHRVLEAIADCSDEKPLLKNDLTLLLLPDSSGILRHAAELIYNDAPWLNSVDIPGKYFLNTSISNDLANRLGVKLLSRISFVDDDTTKSIPCMDFRKVKELLELYGSKDLLLFDLIELAECCKASKVHLIFDKRKHAKLSLLQHNLGEYQGPALVAVLEGVSLTREEVSCLQLLPPWKLRGDALNYGLGLQTCYSICDLLTLISGGFYYIFDPRGVALGSSNSPTAKVFPLAGTNLSERFTDQFRPMLVFQDILCSTSDSTIIRMPLPSEFLENEAELGSMKVNRMYKTFKDHASETLIFLKSILQVSLSTWEEGSLNPRQEFSASVDPSSAPIWNLFSEKKWRKFQISRLFNNSSAVTESRMIDVNISAETTRVTDRWLVVFSLGSGQTRNMALDRRYLAYNLTPVAGVAAHISRNGQPASASEGTIMSPLPLSVCTSLPVSIFGCFLVCHNGARSLFNNQEKNSSSRSDPGYLLIDAWNRELMSCVRDSYVGLVIEMQKLGEEPSPSNAEMNSSRAAAPTIMAYEDQTYHFWPRSKRQGTKRQLANSDQVARADTISGDRDFLVDEIIRPFYARVVDLPLWKLYSGNYVKCDDGMFLSQPGNGVAANLLPTTVCSFVKEHYPVFSVPWELVTEVLSVGITVKEIKPRMVRSLLRMSKTSIVIHSVETYADVLEYCLSDVQLPGAGEDEGSDDVVSGTQSSASSADAFEVVTSLGRALFDFGRVVVEDIGRAGGPIVQRNSFNADGNLQILHLVREIKGLPCPTASNQVVQLGISELWIGNADQQTLMMPLAGKFIHPNVMERPVVANILSDIAMQKLLKVKQFSLQLLSEHMRLLFSGNWVNHVLSSSMTPWFSWDSGSESCGEDGPSHHWIRLFWKCFDGSPENLQLFLDWPVVPAFLGRNVLCRVKERQLVFYPPFGDSDLNPWLFPLLNKLNIPVFDSAFSECVASCGCLSHPGESLGHSVASKLFASKHAGYFPGVPSLSAMESDQLFKLFAHDFVSNLSSYSAGELDVLRSLPIYKTGAGAYTHLKLEEHFIVSSKSILKPPDELFLGYTTESAESVFLRTLGVAELTDLQVLTKFALPGFESKHPSEQEDILIYLYGQWEDLQVVDSLLDVMKDTKFVRTADEFSADLSRPRDLFDPSDRLLTSVFSAERNKFPGERFTSDGWLRILRKVGLRRSSEADVILECARKVELLGIESMTSSEQPNTLERDVGIGEVSQELWSLAALIVETIFANFASLYGNDFCSLLATIGCVPAELGFPNNGAKRVLTSYSEAILFKDWPLVWSSSPILSKHSVVPPEYAWGALRLRSDPAFSTVLRHLKTVGKNGGEETLARWPVAPGLISVVDASCLVLKYLDKIWDSLSHSDVKELQSVAFIPAANGTRLVMASSLFARLPINLSPFAFELPSVYLPNVKILKKLGLQDAFSESAAMDLISNLQSSCGYQRLNPNEMRAVLDILDFLYNANESFGNSNWRTDAIVPDEGCRLVVASSCVYLDSYGSRFYKFIDSSRLRFVHPDVPERVASFVGIKKLSDVVVEELVTDAPLVPLETIGELNLSLTKKKLMSGSFQKAVWSLANGISWVAPDAKILPLEAVENLLEHIAARIQFVKRIETRFLLLPKGIDISTRGSPLPEWDDEFAHRSVFYVDPSKCSILVSEPPPYIPILDVIAIVISHVLGASSTLPLAPLLLCPHGSESAILGKLKLHSEPKPRDFFGCNMMGKELLPADALRVQLHPLRPFYKDEIVAWRSQNGEKLKYGKLPADVRPPAGQGLYKFSVEIAPNLVESILSSQVFSFKSASGSTEYGPEVSPTKGKNDAMVTEKSSEIAGTSSTNFNSNSSQTAEYGRVSAGELVQAVREMLSAAGIDMDMEKQDLLKSSIALQQHLKESQAALLLEQERADHATREADQAKAAWTCRVCLSNEVEMTIIPCGHVLCRRCSSAVSRCPFCRLQVSRTIRIFRP